MKKYFIIATAGHVDHGKSALVKALTGTDPDRLPEEKSRGITIDLGFAELNLSALNGDETQAGIVDVPGHEDFVRNMIAGVGSVDLALFVVAADDGWMPQTEEHLQIVSYLGVRRAVIALTKADLGNVKTITAQIREQLRQSPFADARIIPTSVRAGEGIDDLKEALAAEFRSMQPQRDYRKPRLFVDRVFTLHGIGTVVTGSLTGGQLRRGQKVVIHPGNIETRIRSIESHGRQLEFAQPGMRTAINLPDVIIESIKRGHVITVADLDEPSSTLIAQLDQSSRLTPAPKLKTGASVYVHHGTSRVAAKITRFEQSGFATLKLASPIFAFLGDRFVLRDPSERQTIAGGVVLDPDGSKTLLSPVAADHVDRCVRADVARREFARKETILTKSRFGADEIANALVRLEKAGEIVIRGDIAANNESWNKLRAAAVALIDRAQQQHPHRSGLDLNELRNAWRGLHTDVFDALVSDLCAKDFVRRNASIARATHRPTLPQALQSTYLRIREKLSEKPFDPPSRKEIELDGDAKQVLRFMIDNGEAIEIASDVVLLKEKFEEMRAKSVDFISGKGPATVSDLRQAMQSSRRIVVPFLERLDRDGVTRRVGDKRMIATQSVTATSAALD